MIVQDFDGRKYKWPPMGHVPYENEIENRSSHHLRARDLLKQLFETQRILEEVPLPGTNKLKLDFYIPNHQLAIEVHGEQHYKYIPYFHKSVYGFLQAQGNDRKKQEWCELNNIRLIKFSYNESDDEWMNRLQK